MDTTLWEAYKDRGVQVWAIGGEAPLANLEAFRDQLGIDLPILYDAGGTVHDQYNIGRHATNTAYPQDWIVGIDGTVVYLNNAYEPDEIIAVLEAELDATGR